MRDHGGNIDWAIQRFGGNAGDWIDLSTGINRVPYPVGALPETCWRALPTASSVRALHDAARRRYRSDASILALAGAQAAIQLIPRLAPVGDARVLGPTYNEHAAALRACGWRVSEVGALDALAGADLAVVVNPNNPDGRRSSVAELLALRDQVGRLVVDESFADADADAEVSVAPSAGDAGLLVLRSFGKFYGLGGLRLGFVLGCATDINALAGFAGPWPVSGPAIEIGRAALSDDAWTLATITRLEGDARRLDDLAAQAGWGLVGGTALFRLYEMPDAHSVQYRLGEAQIWSRTFPWSKTWVRLGLPGNDGEWARLEAAMRRRA